MSMAHISAAISLAATSGGDQTLSTAVIGGFTLVATAVTMYLIARGAGRQDDD